MTSREDELTDLISNCLAETKQDIETELLFRRKARKLLRQSKSQLLAELEKEVEKCIKATREEMQTTKSDKHHNGLNYELNGYYTVLKLIKKAGEK